MSTITLYRPNGSTDTHQKATVITIENGVLTFKPDNPSGNSYLTQKYVTNMPFTVED